MVPTTGAAVVLMCAAGHVADGELTVTVVGSGYEVRATVHDAR
jgi:hypothetical protein